MNQHPLPAGAPAATLTVALDRDGARYAAGEAVSGSVVLELGEPARCEGVELAYGWDVVGPVGTDAGEWTALPLEVASPELPAGVSQMAFSFSCPAGPFSQQGHLTVRWRIRARASLAWARDPEGEAVFELVAGAPPGGPHPYRASDPVEARPATHAEPPLAPSFPDVRQMVPQPDRIRRTAAWVAGTTSMLVMAWLLLLQTEVPVGGYVAATFVIGLLGFGAGLALDQRRRARHLRAAQHENALPVATADVTLEPAVARPQTLLRVEVKGRFERPCRPRQASASLRCLERMRVPPPGAEGAADERYRSRLYSELEPPEDPPGAVVCHAYPFVLEGLPGGAAAPVRRRSTLALRGALRLPADAAPGFATRSYERCWELTITLLCEDGEGWQRTVPVEVAT